MLSDEKKKQAAAAHNTRGRKKKAAQNCRELRLKNTLCQHNSSTKAGCFILSFFLCSSLGCLKKATTRNFRFLRASSANESTNKTTHNGGLLNPFYFVFLESFSYFSPFHTTHAQILLSLRYNIIPLYLNLATINLHKMVGRKKFH